MSDCTGIAASWCPVHGDCVCRRDETGEIEWHWEPGYVSVHGFPAWSETARSVSHHSDDCPLHGYRSQHGDDDVWALAEAADQVAEVAGLRGAEVEALSPDSSVPFVVRLDVR